MPIKKPCAFINARSGSTSDITQELSTKLAENFETVGPVEYVSPELINDGIKNAIQEGCDLVIIYGGDGSALTAARLATGKTIPIVALPGGTMNLLPKALYDTADWEIALDKALTCSEARWIAAGDINGEMFLCGCMIGTPTRMNEVREQLRDKNIKEAAEDLIFNLSNFQTDDVLEYGLGPNPKNFHKANLLNIACPQMSDHKTGRGGMEINAVDVDTIQDIAGLGLSAIASDWRESDHTDTNIASQISVTGNGRIDALLDGEPMEIALPFEISLNRKGVLVLAP